MILLKKKTRRKKKPDLDLEGTTCPVCHGEYITVVDHRRVPCGWVACPNGILIFSEIKKKVKNIKRRSNPFAWS